MLGEQAIVMSATWNAGLGIQECNQPRVMQSGVLPNPHCDPASQLELHRFGKMTTNEFLPCLEIFGNQPKPWMEDEISLTKYRGFLDQFAHTLVNLSG